MERGKAVGNCKDVLGNDLSRQLEFLWSALDHLEPTNNGDEFDKYIGIPEEI